MNKKKIFVSGSLAYDRIMDFPGKFSDHILPEKIHALNISFPIDQIQENFGGTAGNISYTLALLGFRPVILSSAGNDFSRYGIWLEKHGVDISQVSLVKEFPCSSAHIITDTNDNQITGFYQGAMKVHLPSYDRMNTEDAAFAIVAPGNIRDMMEFSQLYAKKRVPYIFDPGQAIFSFHADDLKQCIKSAKMLIVNDYELASVLEKTKLQKAEITRHSVVITTLGEKGSFIETGEEKYHIPPALPKAVVDPTGAGDAYRAGLIFGIVSGCPWEKCGKIGSVAAVYTVEQYGTQTHAFTVEEFQKRYRENFGEEIHFNVLNE